MESTGVYWISIFEMLEAAGIRVYLVNARHFKIVPGRNSDHGTLLLNVQTGTARDRDWDIYRLPTDSGTAVPVLNADWREENPRVSPDGRWLAYQSNEGGSVRTHIRRWPDLSLRTTLPGEPSAGSAPLWAPDGQPLHVLQRQEGSSEDRMVAYELQPRADGMHVVGQRVVLQMAGLGISSVHPDGRLLAFVRDDSEAPTPPPLIAVMNWHEVLRQRMGR